MRFLLFLAAVAAASWLCNRLWPAVRSEPSTWLGEDWRSKLPV
ncbi:MAG TPA: hypothetical protein VFC93_01465 [Chloroflexota bacterium]|nr:hypothetical protein [Chloroflexota bacterium]